MKTSVVDNIGPRSYNAIISYAKKKYFNLLYPSSSTTTNFFRSPGRAKKHSLPSSPRLVPTLSLNTCDSHNHVEDNDVTKQLETAVRKMSRGSPNLQGCTATNRHSRGSPSRFSTSPYLTELTLHSNRMGLSGLARGYEQYRESLMSLRPATEFGEASSDDLSSEWESSSESESSPVGNTFTGFPGTGSRRNDVSDGSQIGFIDKSGEGQDSGSGDQAATPIMRTTSKRVRYELVTKYLFK